MNNGGKFLHSVFAHCRSLGILLGVWLVCLMTFAAEQPSEPLTLSSADNSLAIAERMIQGGIYDRALELAQSVLDNPEAQAIEGDSADIFQWLQRREKSRFILEQARLGLAQTRDEFRDVALAFVQLANNRYRLDEPAYNIQSAYWAARAFESAEDYRQAVDYFNRVGGIALPAGMEGDAAQRTSRSLRKLAEEIPYPGSMRDRDRRNRLLNQAIGELDRARLAFPVGNRRKEIELDRIALRMARREEQFIREAATEAEAFIDSDPTKDDLRARAVLYRGNAATLLGHPEDAAAWYRKVLDEEAPSDEDRRLANISLALALVEMSESYPQDKKRIVLEQAGAALDNALAGTESPGRWDGARVVKARVQLLLAQPIAALETLRPALNSDQINYSVWQAAGQAEMGRGRLDLAYMRLYPTTRPSNTSGALRYTSSRDASRAADAERDFGLALALNHQASRLLRTRRLFSTLLTAEFQAMETILKMGKMEGPMSLSGDMDLLMAGIDAPVVPLEQKQDEAFSLLAAALGAFLAGSGNPPDAGYDLAIAAEAADEWLGSGVDKLELAIGMISHLRKREPTGVTDSILSSRLGEARHALALAQAERILAAPEPSDREIDKTLGIFAAAATSFQEASADGYSLQDSLDQGMVNMESGAFLVRLADKWNTGEWAGRALAWREEARQRIEASLRPFNQAIATSGPSSLASRRAKWSRGQALELMGEYRSAASDYLSLINNSELPRILRTNAARRWAACMAALGEQRQALTRLSAFADVDAESALMVGKLAEDSGYLQEAYNRYLFAANRSAPVLPSNTPWRVQEASYRAARLALAAPHEADPLRPSETTILAARDLLRDGAFADLEGLWVVPMLTLLSESLMDEDPPRWEEAQKIALDVIDDPRSDETLDRAMLIIAARALRKGGKFEAALTALDEAREMLEGSPNSRSDTATITLETARIYQNQNRTTDALRAYADVFAIYPEVESAAEAARLEAAEMLLAAPDAGAREQEQARNILSGLRDQMLAEKILRDHGIR